MTDELLLVLNPPLLSKQRGCVAAWHAGGLNGPAIASDGRLRDFISDTYHAQFGSTTGSDSNDPLQLLPELGRWSIYFPGTAGNSATITLNASTTYDYTITYSDATTDTDSQASDGDGLLTFGGTDAKFAGLKVHRIVVVPDGGGATVADIDFSRQSLWDATRTNLMAVTGQTVTINRTATGRKASVVDRPLLLMGTDDYLEVADHAALNFGIGDMTMAIGLRKYGTSNTNLMQKKNSSATGTAGYQMFATSARGSDGTTQTAAALTLTVGLPIVPLLRRSRMGVAAFVGGTLQNETPDSSGSWSNDRPLRVGANSAATPGGFGDFEFFGAAIFRRALTDNEIRHLNRELLGVPV